jgi:monofunctional biosynthetic peptidoglycan transglycosylase
MGTDLPTGKRRMRLRWLLWAPLVLMVFSVLQVAVLRFVDPPLSMVMASDQVGRWIHGPDRSMVAYAWVDGRQMAGCLGVSLVAAEDQQFPFHHGFDLDAIAKARNYNARGGKVRGASTISQQVAKNLFLWHGRSWLRKGLEAWYTALIELMWPKSRIIEVYANIAEFGDGVYGAQAASRRFFGRDAQRLNAGQCARLAAVLPAPRRYDAANPGPYVRRRAQWIERQVRQLGGPAYLEAGR